MARARGRSEPGIVRKLGPDRYRACTGQVGCEPSAPTAPGSVSRVHGAGTATTDGDAGGSGRSTGKSCRNSPTFATGPETRAETCLRIIRECPPRPEPVYHPPRPSDPAQTLVAGGSWMLVSGTGALPVLPGTALWPPGQICNRISRNRRYDSFSFNGTQLIPDVSPATPWTQTDPTPQRSAEQTTPHSAPFST